jgi:glycine betaine catabolism B
LRRFGAGHVLAMLFLAGVVVLSGASHVARRRRTRALLAQLDLAVAPDPERSAGIVPSSVPVPASVTGNWAGKLRVARIFDEVPGVKTFRLAAQIGAELPFSFEPGQFLTVSVPHANRRVARSYSIASSPCCHGWCDITVKHVPGGIVSTYLHGHVRAGDALEVSGPYGRFTYSGRDASRIVLVAGGIGITPLMSAIRYLTDQSWAGEIHLLHAAASRAKLIFGEELEILGRRHPNLHITTILSDEPASEWPWLRGYITAGVLERAVPDIAHAHIHLCGPPAMMETVRSALTTLGVPAEHVHSELFLGPETGPIPAAALGATTVPVCSFARSGRSVPLAANMTILEAAESIGIALQYACRQGYCGMCKVKLLSGEVTMAVEDGLAPADKAAGLVLACQARARTDVGIDA